MKNLLAAAGGILLVLCGLLTVVTINAGGVKHLAADGSVTEILTWQGWQPADEWRPQPTSAPNAQPIHPTTLPLAMAEPPRSNPARSPTFAPPESLAAPVVAAVVIAAPAYEPPPAAPITGTSTAAPTRLSPWEALGWILVGLVSASGVTALGLAIYHTVARLRNRVLTAGAGVVPPTAAPAGPSLAPALAGTPGPGVDVVAFLADMAVPGGER